jgi:pimeloyl-ACP methyl ester carboxylesterase
MNLQVQGADIYVSETGEGEPILFLHGVPDSSEIWSDVVTRLETGFRCVAPDWPAFGRSGPGEWIDCSLDGHADFVRDLADGLGLSEPFHLVGHDFGGISAMAFTSKYPDRVKRLAISNAPFSPDYHWHLWARIWQTPRLGEFTMLTMNRLAFNLTLRAASKKLTKQHMQDAYRFVDRDIKRMILRMYRAMPPEGWIEWHPRLLEATSRIPTLMLWGENDPFLPNWLPEKYGAREIIRYPNSGHWTPAEEPEEFSTELKRFFSA